MGVIDIIQSCPCHLLLFLCAVLGIFGLGLAAEGNCVAGGSSHGVSFDWNQADVIGLLGLGLPANDHTVEYWYKNTNLHADATAVHTYSAYNVRGYLGEQQSSQGSSSGEPYEQANEVHFGFGPNVFRLWRAADIAELEEAANPKAAVYTTEWRHFAFSVKRETAEVAFYIDGEMLDFAFSSISTVNNDASIRFKTLDYSNKWDEAESEDAQPYYGVNQELDLVVIQDACDESQTEGKDFSSNGVLVKISNSCSQYRQAKAVAEATGAYMIIMLEVPPDPAPKIVFGVYDMAPLSTAVISVPVEDFAALEDAGKLVLTRSKQSFRSMGSAFNLPIEQNGILHIGQEPDAPWSDFDETQSANGVLDEYRFWNTTRTPDQIKENYRLTIQPNSADYQDLAIYWKFDAEPTLNKALKLVTKDSSSTGMNQGLLGGLPTVENELQYVTARGKVPPTVPKRIITTASPIVGLDQEHVVPVVPGEETVLELKSFDPDGDDLSTVIVNLPTSGSLHALDEKEQAGAKLSAGSEVVDVARSESKRIVYRATSDFDTDNTFVYTVSDGGVPVRATVRLVPHVIFQPTSKTETMSEDGLVYLFLALPSQLDQQNMQVEITTLPSKGQLYQAKFNPDATYKTYEAIAKTVDEYGEMEPITVAGEILNTYSGIAMYQPNKDEHSSGPDDIYASFTYRFIDPSRIVSENATISIVVNAVNDAPIAVPGEIKVGVGEQVIIGLDTTDVDADAVESFAERAYSQIVSFPLGGRVYQYDEEAQDDNNRGEYMDSSVTAVPLTFAFASRVVRYSSQFSACGKSCFDWRNPDCEMNDLLSGGRENGTCSSTGWHASNILGEPDFYPIYADAKRGWDKGREGYGNEFIELAYPFDVYVSSFELYETFKPGTLWKISTTDNYIDDAELHCSGYPDIEGVPKCSEDTEWITLWTRPQQSVTFTGDKSQIFAPPVCPSTKKSNLIRLDFDTSRVAGWNNLDAARVTGSLVAPPGLLDDSLNRLVYVPLDGVHGMDKLSFMASDCLDMGEPADYLVEILTPPSGLFSRSALITQDVLLDISPGNVTEQTIDLTNIIETINEQTRTKVADVSVIIWKTEAVGSKAGESFDSISLEKPFITLILGLKTRVPSMIELWLKDPASGLTFRVHYMVKINVPCENGSVDDTRGVCVCTSGRWAGTDCSIEVAENKNWIPIGILVVGYIMFAINFLIIAGAGVFVTLNRTKGAVQISQPFFLYLLLAGCLLCTLTIVLLQIEGSNIACVMRPWFWSLGFSIMFGALFAKIFRVYTVFKHGRAMKRRKVTIAETMKPVFILLAINTIILIVWTVLDPFLWSRNVAREDGYDYVLDSFGQCASKNVLPYLLPLCAINSVAMIIAIVLSYMARNIPSEYQEGKGISLAVFSCIEVYFIGVPVLGLVYSTPSISAFVQSAIIFLTTLAVLLLIFGPLVQNVYFQGNNEEEADMYRLSAKQSVYSQRNNNQRGRNVLSTSITDLLTKRHRKREMNASTKSQTVLASIEPEEEAKDEEEPNSDSDISGEA